MDRRKFWAAFVVACALGLASCAQVARLDDDQLVSSGFTKVKTDTPQWAAAAKSLPVHKFTRRMVNGTPVILYSDPVACGCVYSASPAVYAGYRAVRRAEMKQLEDASIDAGGDN